MAPLLMCYAAHGEVVLLSPWVVWGEYNELGVGRDVIPLAGKFPEFTDCIGRHFSVLGGQAVCLDNVLGISHG